MPFIIAVLMIFMILLIHEGGHALTALALGIPIKEFAIGVPWPKALTIKIGKIRISPFLILASVTIDDEDYNRASLLQKSLIALAGPLSNFMVGIIVALIFFGRTKGIFISGVITDINIFAVGTLFTTKTGLSNLASPIAVVEIAAKLIAADFKEGFLLMWLVLSFGIPVVNLLPIPALDGGQILTAVICHAQGNTPKAIKGSRMVTTAYFSVFMAGMILLVLKDILHFFQ